MSHYQTTPWVYYVNYIFQKLTGGWIRAERKETGGTLTSRRKNGITSREVTKRVRVHYYVPQKLSNEKTINCLENGTKKVTAWNQAPSEMIQTVKKAERNLKKKKYT